MIKSMKYLWGEKNHPGKHHSGILDISIILENSKYFQWELYEFLKNKSAIKERQYITH